MCGGDAGSGGGGDGGDGGGAWGLGKQQPSSTQGELELRLELYYTTDCQEECGIQAEMLSNDAR